MTIPNPAPVDALFVGYEDQENLGLRSIIASLKAQGMSCMLVPFRPGDTANVLAAALEHEPALIGFSVIFQYTLDEFATLMGELRRAGVQAHFTAGGHYPSLRPDEVLRLVPELDSIVRFEGEITVAELLRHPYEPAYWRSIQGLAYRRGREIVVNPPRELIRNLDALPLPERDRPRLLPRGILTASVLASRGCLFNCSFCSIRQFYGSAPGPLRRTRSPGAVVAEMEGLYRHDNVRLFIFQDDDFAARSVQQRRWLAAFLRELDDSGLVGQVAFKISCRVDDIDAETIEQCRQRGLVAVYLGVESGSETGLRTLNKHVTVAQNLAAIETLKRLGVAFDMGFMLFDPTSTLETIEENLTFLNQVTADGACPVNFCKMLPYAGTPIEERLRYEDRLKGTPTRPDYDFPDPRVDWYALFTGRVFRFRNFDRLGLVERLRLARFDQVLAQTFEPAPWVQDYEAAILRVTARANLAALDTLHATLRFVAQRDADALAGDWALMGYQAEKEWQSEAAIQAELDDVLAAYSPELLRSFADEFRLRMTEPVPRAWPMAEPAGI
jgi:radical SAM superfamily enzyme YgiQ (UPF0313 family)